MTSPARTVATAAAVWFAVASTLAFLGVFAVMPPPLGIAPLVALTMAAWVGVYFLVPGVREAVSSVGLWWLTALHVWRIAPGFLFVWYAGEGLLPQTFADRAGWGDVVAGVVALAAIFTATRARIGRRT